MNIARSYENNIVPHELIDHRLKVLSMAIDAANDALDKRKDQFANDDNVKASNIVKTDLQYAEHKSKKSEQHFMGLTDKTYGQNQYAVGEVNDNDSQGADSDNVAAIRSLIDSSYNTDSAAMQSITKTQKPPISTQEYNGYIDYISTNEQTIDKPTVGDNDFPIPGGGGTFYDTAA